MPRCRLCGCLQDKEHGRSGDLDCIWLQIKSVLCVLFQSGVLLYAAWKRRVIFHPHGKASREASAFFLSLLWWIKTLFSPSFDSLLKLPSSSPSIFPLCCACKADRQFWCRMHLCLDQWLWFDFNLSCVRKPPPGDDASPWASELKHSILSTLSSPPPLTERGGVKRVAEYALILYRCAMCAEEGTFYLNRQLPLLFRVPFYLVCTIRKTVKLAAATLAGRLTLDEKAPKKRSLYQRRTHCNM